MKTDATSNQGSTESAAMRFEALHALYQNKQDWIRHYETLLAQLTPLSATTSLAFSAYIADKSSQLLYAKWTLIIPLVISMFSLWFTWWCDSEIRRQFRQIVTSEIGMGFYDIKVENEYVLPGEYKESPVTTRPIVVAGYLAQLISLIAFIAVLSVI